MILFGLCMEQMYLTVYFTTIQKLEIISMKLAEFFIEVIMQQVKQHEK